MPDTDTAQLTHIDLQQLHTRLWELVEMVTEADIDADQVALAELMQADHRTLLAAVSVVHRLALGLRGDYGIGRANYLPRPEAQQPLRSV